MKTIKQKFETNDGKVFETEQEAVAHEKECKAIDKFNQAYEELKQLMVKDCQTADGHSFEFGLFREYYYVTNGNRPWLLKIDFSGYDFYIEKEEGELEIGTSSYQDGKYQYRFYKISELYYNEKEAIKELIKRKKECIGWLEDEIKEKEKRITIGR